MFAFVWLAACAFASAAPVAQLKVMSFNLWPYGPDATVSNWANVIRTNNADIAGLQECRPAGREANTAGQLGGKVYALSRIHAVEMGSAPASGAVGRALAAHGVADGIHPPFGASRGLRVRRGGAPNSSRGGCAPHDSNCIVPVEAVHPLTPGTNLQRSQLMAGRQPVHDLAEGTA